MKPELLAKAFKSYWVVALFSLNPNLNHAADVRFYSVQKAQKYNQVSSGAPALGSGNPYRFEAIVAPSLSNAVQTATVSTTGVPPQTLTLDPVSGWYSFNAKFASQALLDASTPSGNYTVVVNTLNQGQKSLSLNLTTETFPPAPHINNWTEAQAIDPTANFTLKWDAFTGGTTNDFIFILMGDGNSGTVTFRSPDPYQPGALNGTAKSVLIPAASLQPNTQYQLEITFIKVKSQNTNSYPGAIGVVGFNSFTDTGLMTTSAPVQFDFSLRQFATAGSFLNSTNATPQFPVAINGYRAELIVTGTTNFLPPTQVSFTGPLGSGLTNSSSGGANAFTQSGSAGLYFSPKINQPALAPGGAWSVDYGATVANFTAPDPQAASHLVVPVPTVFLSNGAVANVNWRLYDPAGNLLTNPPSVLSAIVLQQVNLAGTIAYASPGLSPATLSFTFTNFFAWTNLAGLRFLYQDTLNNSYVITYPNVIVTTPSQLAAISHSASGLGLQLTGQAGLSYRVQFSSDLAHWNDLVATNLTTSTLQLIDSKTTGAPARFYRAMLGN